MTIALKPEFILNPNVFQGELKDCFDENKMFKKGRTAKKCMQLKSVYTAYTKALTPEKKVKPVVKKKEEVVKKAAQKAKKAAAAAEKNYRAAEKAADKEYLVAQKAKKAAQKAAAADKLARHMLTRIESIMKNADGNRYDPYTTLKKTYNKAKMTPGQKLRFIKRFVSTVSYSDIGY
jgi:hypothetical protein